METIVLSYTVFLPQPPKQRGLYTLGKERVKLGLYQEAAVTGRVGTIVTKSKSQPEQLWKGYKAKNQMPH